MEIRPYSIADRDACLAVFDSNSPAFFDASERPGFAAFLDGSKTDYFVMEYDESIVGWGGFAIDSEHSLANLLWGMVRLDSHKLGLGRFLLLYRIREISKVAGVQRVRLRASQLTAGFFEKQGFKVTDVVKNGYAIGIDRVEMVMKLSVCP